MTVKFKKALLWFIIVACLVVIVAVNGTTTTETIEDTANLNESTCINSAKSLASAKFQKKMLDQQVLLSTAGGRATEATIASAQVTELDGMIRVLEKLIADPKLECSKYIKP